MLSTLHETLSSARSHLVDREGKLAAKVLTQCGVKTLQTSVRSMLFHVMYYDETYVGLLLCKVFLHVACEELRKSSVFGARATARQVEHATGGAGGVIKETTN